MKCSRKTLILFALAGAGLALIAAGCRSAAPASAADCPAGSNVEQLASGGQSRAYLLHVPPAYRPGVPAPVVLGFHGAGSNAGQFEAYSGLSSLADQAGFIAVYPDALPGPDSWNTLSGSPDVQFVRDLLDDLQRRCSVDPGRIYATGHSRGGGLANRLACDLAERIAAIGPVSGTYKFGENCSPSRPVPVIAFHGTDDPVILYNGFDSLKMPPASYTEIGTPVLQWASGWAERDGCSPRPAVILQEQHLTGQAWSGCRAGAEVVFYTVIGGKHGWPGGLGEPAVDFDAARMIWDFFIKHPNSDKTSP